jgi:hypothetical protein
MCLLAGLTTSAAIVNGSQETPTLPDDEVMAPERELAALQFKVGLRVVFSYDETAQEFGMVQQGLIDRTGPLVHGDVDSLLGIYLAITPRNLPVPELLLMDAPPELASQARALRKITASPVQAIDLDLPIGIVPPVAASQGCFDTWFSWFDWHDDATVGMAPHTYYASSFGGRHRYSDSYVANCTPAGSPSWLYARHRVYYRKSSGSYKLHHEGKVTPGHFEAVHKGSVKRYRKVAYDDGWGSLASCGSTGGFSCKYTREGRFHN